MVIQLDIDTSTLSNIEKVKRKASSMMLKVFLGQLNLPLYQVECCFFEGFYFNIFFRITVLKNKLSRLIKEL